MALENAPALAITGFITIGLGLIVLIIGYLQAKAKNYNNHRKLMIGAAIINGIFLIQYIIRYLTVGNTEFEGPDMFRNFVYLPVLVIHITLAIITIILVVIHLIRSLKQENWANSGVVYFDKEYRSEHRSFGKITLSLWLISYIGGILIFIFLYLLF